MSTIQADNLQSTAGGAVPVPVADIQNVVQTALANPPSVLNSRAWYLAVPFVHTPLISSFAAISGALVDIPDATSGVAGFAYDPITGLHTCVDAGTYTFNSMLRIVNTLDRPAYAEIRVNGIRAAASACKSRQLDAHIALALTRNFIVGDTVSSTVYALTGSSATVEGTLNYYSTFSYHKLSTK